MLLVRKQYTSLYIKGSSPVNNNSSIMQIQVKIQSLLNLPGYSTMLNLDILNRSQNVKE